MTSQQIQKNMLHAAPSSPAVVAKWRAGIPSAERINSIFKSFDHANESANRAAQVRMENYYNCLDDYSWGGICDRAAAQARSERDMVRSSYEKVLAGETPKGSYDLYFLETLDGTFATSSCVTTKYGKAWMIKENEYSTPKWISVAKTAKTYEKKGYRLMKVSFEYEYYYVQGKDGWRKESIITSVETSPVEDFSFAYNYDTPFHLWIAMKREEELVAA